MKTVRNNKWKFITIGVVVGVILCIGILSAIKLYSEQKIQNKELIKLTTLADVKKIKEVLGDDYETGIYERDNTKQETYKTITVRNADVNFITVKYDSENTFETIFIGISTKEDGATELANDFIKTYGKDYEHTESKDKKSYRYEWTIDSNRSVSLDVMYTDIGHTPYNVAIISSH